MGNSKLRGRHLIKIGYKEGRVVGIAVNVMQAHFKHHSRAEKLDILSKILEKPEDFKTVDHLSLIANELLDTAAKIEANKTIPLKTEKPDYRVFGRKNIADNAVEQMDTAMRLPVTVAGALMPDAHHGYGLPIGGVLATRNEVIPYGVGVDIGCRMCLTLYDMPTSYIAENTSFLKKALMEDTRFGAGKGFDQPIDHEVLENPVFKEIQFVRNLKDVAYRQIGSSGGGNHFVEFGISTILDPHNEWQLPVGDYLAILSHSGSRGLGANIARQYTKIAMEQCRLPKDAKHLAWLSLDSEAGIEYWMAMNLAGDYASACHHQIHQRLSQTIGEKPLAMIENHHNFAWKETLHDGSNIIVHRKGATPAGKGVLGIIPGSMTAPGFIVRGKGAADSINSASHGAGRQLSRRKAKENINKKDFKRYLKQQGVVLLGGGLDEAPMAYKDIHEVMRQQSDLVDIVGQFAPKIVRMASD